MTIYDLRAANRKPVGAEATRLKLKKSSRLLTSSPTNQTFCFCRAAAWSELQRHLPVMLGALKLIQEKLPAAKAKMVLPNQALKELADKLSAPPANFEIQIGNLPQALAEADLAIASTGTVTMECAFFGVPTVTLYKTSWLNYEIAKRIVTVKWPTMPNLLANEEVYPEFIQNAATPENIARAALELLQNESRRQKSNRSSPKLFPRSANPAPASARPRRF